MAVKRSLQEQEYQARENKVHEKKLDRILFVNGYQRIPITRDGNCLFAAVCFNHTIDINSQLLREMVSAYLIDQPQKYLPFFPDMTYKNYIKKARKIKKSGRWNSEIMDAVPQVISNVLCCKLLVFKSDGTVTEVMPKESNNKRKRVCLAYYKVLNKEHYDAVSLVTDTGMCMFNRCYIINTSFSPIRSVSKLKIEYMWNFHCTAVAILLVPCENLTYKLVSTASKCLDTWILVSPVNYQSNQNRQMSGLTTIRVPVHLFNYIVKIRLQPTKSVLKAIIMQSLKQ